MLKLRNINEHDCTRLTHVQLRSPEDVVMYTHFLIIGSYDRTNNWYEEEKVGAATIPFYYLDSRNNNNTINVLDILHLPDTV